MNTKNKTTRITGAMIAPCGINCAVCLAQFRMPRSCSGCMTDDPQKPRSCSACIIKNCPDRLMNGYRYCFDCPGYPCARLKRLDLRYRKGYGVSVFDNLRRVKERGIRAFVRHEKELWRCATCGAVLCMHREHCPACGHKRRIKKKQA